MAHLTLQLGAALVVPFPVPGRRGWVVNLRQRALREAGLAAPAGMLGGRCQTNVSDPANRLPPRGRDGDAR